VKKGDDGRSSDISVNFLPLTFEISCSGITGTMPPRHHFIEYGWKEGRNPNANFNAEMLSVRQSILFL